jgi:hypothetical protein
MSKAGRPIGKLHQDDIRKKIQASQLINVLQDHALTGEGEITPTRMKAIEILLRKSIPDLSSVEISGDAENPLNMIQQININLKKPNES